MEETVEVIQEVQEDVKNTNWKSEMVQEDLRRWINPNASCWIRDGTSYTVDCDY